MKALMTVIVEVENMKKGEENVIIESWKKIENELLQLIRGFHKILKFRLKN